MKLLSFSPWQQCNTSLPSRSSDEGDVVHRIVNLSSGNRSRDKNVDAIPTLALTTPHQISVLGKTGVSTFKKRVTKSPQASVIKEMPQWIYTSRPGENSSFFSKNEDKKKPMENAAIGAIVDSNADKIYCLQKKNMTLKVWDLDANLDGPDDDSGDKKHLQKVEFDSPVICMELIPMKRRTGKRSENNAGDKAGRGDISSGVVGLLANGNVFIVLVPIFASRNLKVGIFGKEERNGTRRKSNRHHSNGLANGHSFNGGKSLNKNLMAIASFSLSSEGTNTTTENSRKRKISSIETHQSDTCPEIILTAFSFNSKKNSVTLTKHVLCIPSFFNCCSHGDAVTNIDASYSQQSSNIELPNIQLESRTSDGLKLSQLDLNHVALVYPSLSNSYQCLVIDTRNGESATEAFSLPMGNSSVIDIGGLSASILSVLSSDNVLRVYDIRRFVLLHEHNVLASFHKGKDELIGSDYNFRISTNWFTGTIGIILKHLETISLSFASIGIFNAENISNESQLSEAGRRPLLRGTYNLASIIASSIASTAGRAEKERPYTKTVDSVDWYSGEKTMSSDCFKSNEKLESFLNNGNLVNGAKNEKKEELSFQLISCSQQIIDSVIATAIDRIHSESLGRDEKKDSVDILNACIKSGKICGRNMFNNTKGDTSLYSLFTALTKSFGEDKPSSKDVLYRPLYLMHSLLCYCKNSVTEHMLVTMIHFVLCHTTGTEFVDHWNKMARNNSWYSDASTTVLRKRQGIARQQLQKTNGDKSRNAELQGLVDSLERKLSTSRQLFFIRKIVTYSKSNDTLLRLALRDCLLQSENGEVETLMLALSSLLRNMNKEKQSALKGSVNRSVCITQWMSALTDAYLGKLLTSPVQSIAGVQKRVTEAVSQAKAVLSLKELVDFVDVSMKEENKGLNRQESLSEPPPYGIEPLIF